MESTRSEAEKKAASKYKAKFAHIDLMVEKEEREAIRNHAASMNESANTFIRRAIRETMDRDLSTESRTTENK